MDISTIVSTVFEHRYQIYTTFLCIVVLVVTVNHIRDSYKSCYTPIFDCMTNITTSISEKESLTKTILQLNKDKLKGHLVNLNDVRKTTHLIMLLNIMLLIIVHFNIVNIVVIVIVSVIQMVLLYILFLHYNLRKSIMSFDAILTTFIIIKSKQ
jgi:hypothetical protein